MMLEGKVMKDVIANGWGEHLLLAPEDAPMVPSRRPKCPRCIDPELDRVGSSLLQVPWSSQECSEEAQKAAVAEASLPLKFRPAFAFGLCVQEVFAGDGPWTEAFKTSRVAARLPVELYEDPLRLQGRRPGHDIKDPVVKTRLQAELDGNEFSDFQCEFCEALGKAGKEFMMESSEWTGAMIVPTHMCPLAEIRDDPTQLHKK